MQDETAAWRRRIEQALVEHLPVGEDVPPGLAETVRYAVMGGGKRLRPILTLATAQALGKNPESMMLCACGIELVHTSSLLLDDLPSMDDHATRRGKATAHRVFGESNAVLAAVSTLCHGVDLVARNAEQLRSPAERGMAAVREVLLAIGPYGLCGGQQLDLISQTSDVDLTTLQQIHSKKTGMLFVAAAATPALLLDAPDETLNSLRSYARRLGQAFQISDDIIDVAEDRTFEVPVRHLRGGNLAGMLGIPAARGLVNDLISSAKEDIAHLGTSAAMLRSLADMVRDRNALKEG